MPALRAKFLIVVLLCASTAHAQEKFSVSLRAGTNGVASALTSRRGNDGDTSTYESGSTDDDVLPMIKGLGDERAALERVAAENGPRLLRPQGASYMPLADEEAKPLRLKPAAGLEPARSHSFGINESLLIAANAADLGTTIYALQQGAHEANPMLGSKLVTIIPLKLVSTYLQVHAVHKLKSEGHTTAARVLSIVISGAIGSLAIHNYAITKK